MRNSFWSVLGIEPTNDVQAIKRAYTSLAHGVNPEDNPEKFREIHDAYKAAVDFAKSGILSVDDSDPTENKDRYDYNQLSNGSNPKETAVDNLIDEIVFFKETNNLTSFQDLSNTPHNVKLELAITLLELYGELAQATDDASVWYTFFDEPLVKYAGQYGLYDLAKDYYQKGTAAHEKINEIISELYSPRIIEENEHIGESSKKDKGFIVFIIVFVILIFIGCIIYVFVSMHASIIDILSVLGIMAIAVIIAIVKEGIDDKIDENYRNRAGNRSVLNEHSGTHIKNR